MTKKRNLPMVRLSDKERLVVSHVAQQLARVYRNTSGKPIYARNMDQVMKDIFGVKKFCKTLEKASRNEAIMIELMKALDIETLWKICRSKEHYRLLCTLVAMDNQIVKTGRKLNRMADMEPTERPTRKIKKTMKELKRSKKMYRECVKTFRSIFDIERVDQKSNSMYDFLSDWLDRNEGGDDYFDFGSYGSFDDDAIESMDEYVRNHSKKKGSSNRPVMEGALGIFDKDDSNPFDAFNSDLSDLDEEEDEEEDDKIDALRSEITDLVHVIGTGFERMQDSIERLGDRREYVEDIDRTSMYPTRPVTRTYRPRPVPVDVDDGDDGQVDPDSTEEPSLDEMIEMTEAYNKSQGATIEATPDPSVKAEN